MAENKFSECQLMLDRLGLGVKMLKYHRLKYHRLKCLGGLTGLLRVELRVEFRSPRSLLGWQPESLYVIPMAEKDALPRSAETRHLAKLRSVFYFSVERHVTCDPTF